MGQRRGLELLCQQQQREEEGLGARQWKLTQGLVGLGVRLEGDE